MKKLAKSLVVAVLGWQVKRLVKKNNLQVIAVAGSTGKTSTKLAIAQALQQKFRVRYQDGNYNDVVSVPLIFFGHRLPSLLNPVAWFRIFLNNESQIRHEYPYDVVVVEVGTDFPGNIAQFKKYLHATIGVLTSVAPEHMEFFQDLDAVAVEELTIAELSDKLLVNFDLVDPKYRAVVKIDASYGISDAADYVIDADGVFRVLFAEQKIVTDLHDIGHGPQRYSLGAAAVVSHLLGLTPEQITKAVQTIQPTSGRGQRLAGLNGSVIIDDTYNASPEAVKSALDGLYEEKATQRIAILGNMNELGSYSESAHKEIGDYCDSSKLAAVLTLGPDANKYLAPAAEAKGCKVSTFSNPYELAEQVKNMLKAGTVVLAKGSQNGVFAEEAVKQLLANPADSTKLVRQSDEWLKTKAKQFPPAKDQA